jgi:AcrR family transcriptional regulator
MQIRTKQTGKGGRPRKFDEGEALAHMQRQLWTTGLSGSSLDGIARSAGLNRPSLAAAFGDKDAIYERAAQHYIAMIDERLNRALEDADLRIALQSAFNAAIDIYTDDGPDGCFVICTAPAETRTNPACRDVLGQSIDAIDLLFLKRLEKEQMSACADLPTWAGMLGSTLHSLALRARAGWSRDRLQLFAAATVDHVTLVLGHSATAAPSRADP